MAKIKHLKTELQKLKNDLIDELHTYRAFHPDVDTAKIAQIEATIQQEYAQLIHRIQHPEKQDKQSVKKHFNSIVDDIRGNFISLLDELNK